MNRKVKKSIIIISSIIIVVLSLCLINPIKYKIRLNKANAIVEKNEIEKVHGFDSNLMKLLHNGVVLEDAKTLRDYNIKDENVIIMMNSKIKPKKNI